MKTMKHDAMLKLYIDIRHKAVLAEADGKKTVSVKVGELLDMLTYFVEGENMLKNLANTSLDGWEKIILFDTLEKCGFHVPKAAKVLNMPEAQIRKRAFYHRIPLGQRQRDETVDSSINVSHDWKTTDE